MRVKEIFHALFFLVMTCPTLGQVSQKTLTEGDYQLWSTMEAEQLSDDGNWVSYSLHYENGADTLFVKHTTTLKTFAFAGGSDGRFAADQHYVYRGQNGAVVLANLKNGNSKRFPGISHYSLALGGRMLIVLESSHDAAGNLLLSDMDGKLLQVIPKSTLFSLSPALDKMVYDSDGKLLLLELNHRDSQRLIDPKPQKYQSVAWQANGNSIAYITDGPEATVRYYQIQHGTLSVFDSNQFADFPKDAEIYNASVTELSISDDGKRVFFGVKQQPPVKDATGVQLWNTADKLTYPRKAFINGWIGRPKLAVWFPEQQHFSMVTNATFPYQELLPGQELALVHNPITHEPQFDYDAPVDYYLQDIITGQQRLVVAKHSPDITKIGISAKGNYIAYFKELHWWVYDVKTGKHRNLTSKTGQSFTDEKYDRAGDELVCGIGGWTTNDDELLVYDSYDVWRLKTDGSSAVRLTKGRETGTTFRVVSRKSYAAASSASDDVLDLREGIVLKAVSSTQSGYFSWATKYGLQPIVFESNRIGGLKKSLTGVYCFTREHYHISPQLVVKGKNGKTSMVYQSNVQQRNYSWGFSKRITYENTQGQSLHGALFYPAGYDAAKSYPMVVYVYERLSNYYNQYVNPTLLNEDGFNISTLTTKGYFVLLPDIAYQLGETGQSAVDCVESAVNEVVSHESIDKNRIGLIGHSFGGYEASFIVTHTSLFAAVISGAGFNDFISSYLTVGLSNVKQDCWRYEYNQLRMGKPLFEGFSQYLKNSPLSSAPQVQTPFLLWAGTDDNSVDYRQSLELHLALRRLGKPNILLLYEKGGHALSKTKHQVDLSRRQLQWWDYYLKDGAKPDWFTPDRL